MTQQWLRRVRVVVGTPDNTKAVQIDERFRISFNVKKKDGSRANEASIKIWGLSNATIEQMRRKNAMIQLYAGHGDVVPLLYKGIITRVKTEGDDAEPVVLIESQKNFITMSRTVLTPDQRAARALWNQGQAYISRVFTSETSVLDGLGVIYNDIKGIAGDYASQIVADFKKIEDGGHQITRAPRGLRLAGSPEAVLDEYAKANNIDIWMEDGVIRAVPRDTASRESAFVLSPRSGLIGAPKQKLAGKNQKGATGVEITCLLNGELRMRRAIQIKDTKILSGWYLIRSVEHSGDSGWEDDFYTKCELTPIKERAPAPPRAPKAAKARSKQAEAAGISAIEEQLGPFWPSYSAARAEVKIWFTQGIWDVTPTFLVQVPDGRWTIATTPTVKRSMQTGQPPIFPVYR